MDLKTLLGANYREGMTFEEVAAALENVVVYTDEDVRTRFVAKNIFDKTASELAAAKRNGTAAAAQAKTELEQAMERIAALETESKEAKRNASIASIKASLLAQGYDDALADETATAMEDNNLAKIIENQGKFLANKTQAIKDELLKDTKPPVTGNGTVTMKKEDFAKMSLAEKTKFAAENPEQYKEIYGGN